MTRSPATDGRTLGHDDTQRVTLIYLLLGSGWILLSDRIKFTASGQVTLRARLLEQNHSGATLQLEVEDSGPGIAAPELERLFTEFEQAGDNLQRQGGSGLGLAITRRLARLMGGEAGAQSQPGSGSRFWFTARLGKREQPAAMISA